MPEEYDEEVAVVKTKKGKKSKRVKDEPQDEEPENKKAKFAEPDVQAEQEEPVVVRQMTKEEEQEGKKERQRMRQSEKDYVRKNTARGKFDNLTVGFISYDEAVKVWKTFPACGFEVVNERRHVSLPYHLLNPASIQKSLEYIANKQIGKYSQKLKGIVVAVGEVAPNGLPRIVDDQTVFHFECTIKQVVFKPRKGVTYEARITHISQNFVSALVLDAITINMNRDKKFDEKQDGLPLGLNDIVKVRYENCEIKAASVRMRGSFEGLVRKGDPNEPILYGSQKEANGPDYELQVKEEQSNAKKSKETPNKKIRYFSDDDEE